MKKLVLLPMIELRSIFSLSPRPSFLMITGAKAFIMLVEKTISCPFI